MGGAGEGDSNLIGYAHDVTARAALDLAFGVDLDRRAALEPIEQAWPTPINAPRERGRCRRLPPFQRHGAQFAEIGDAYTEARRALLASQVGVVAGHFRPRPVRGSLVRRASFRA